MSHIVNLAAVGLGRMGVVHTLHAAELTRERDDCRLVALVDQDVRRAEEMAERHAAAIGSKPRVFATIDELTAASIASAAVVSTPTVLHKPHAEALIAAGFRILLEKPLTPTLVDDRHFAAELERDAPEAVMLGFQRRFDAPLQHAKRLIDDGAIGRPFKVFSVLEDSGPLPDGYVSAGLLTDMSVHNIDEIVWLTGKTPHAAASIGDRLYAHSRTTAEEDYDDALVHLWFEGGLNAQIQVSRNHVSGYRCETWVYGERGHIHVGRFEQSRFDVIVEAYGEKEPIETQRYSMRDYGAGMPEFIDRYGPAYKAELVEFIERCKSGESFSVTHRDGLRAMEIIDAARRGAITARDAAGVPTG